MANRRSSGEIVRLAKFQVDRPTVDYVSEENGEQPPASRSAPPTKIGRYTVLDLLGVGGMGVVCTAYDPKLDRKIALKLLRKRGNKKEHRDSTGQARLIREAQALAKLSHPNIVTVHDVDQFEGQIYMAMEYVDGVSLDQWMVRGQRGWREVLEVFTHAARGLAAAHAAGITHRDFKPANVLIGKDGTVRVADFGMARLVALAIVNEDDTTIPGTDTDRSVSTIVGTPTYMAPEQLLGRLGDHRMDQFSFCLCLYWTLLDHPPFAGRTFQERRRTVPLGLDFAERERLNRARKLPVRVRRALLRGLSVDPAERFATMDDLLDELVERRRWPWTLASVALATGLGLGMAATTDPQSAPCEHPQAALGGAFGPEARRSLVEAIEHTHHPRREEQIENAVGAFQRYADEWQEAYSDACKSTYVTHVQSEAMFDQRMRCLERRKAQLEIAVTTVAEAHDPLSLEARMPVAFRLPALDECGDVAALENSNEEVDGATRARIEALVRRIDEASKMREAGLLQDGLVMATATVSEARELGHLPLLAQALECLGKLQADAVVPQTAEQTLREAIAVGTRGNDDHTVARAWPSLLYTLVMQQELAEGESLKFAAELAIDRATDETARGSLYNILGALYSERGNHELARDYLQRSLSIRIRLRGAQDLDVGTTWSNLGFVLAESRQWSEAADAFQQARAILAAGTVALFR